MLRFLDHKYLLINIVFETVFTIYEYAKEEEAYNKFFLIVRCIIIVIFFELPTFCFQALAMKKFANLKLSDTIENHNRRTRSILYEMVRTWLGFFHAAAIHVSIYLVLDDRTFTSVHFKRNPVCFFWLYVLISPPFI